MMIKKRLAQFFPEEGEVAMHMHSILTLAT
jgi:hypothetical protein